MRGKENKDRLLTARKQQGTRAAESSSQCGGLMIHTLVSQFLPLSECLLPTWEADKPLCASPRHSSEDDSLVPFHGHQR